MAGADGLEVEEGELQQAPLALAGLSDARVAPRMRAQARLPKHVRRQQVVDLAAVHQVPPACASRMCAMHGDATAADETTGAPVWQALGALGRC